MTPRASRWVGGTLAIFVVWLIDHRLFQAPLSTWDLFLLEVAFSAGFFSHPVWRLIKKPKPGDSWTSKT